MQEKLANRTPDPEKTALTARYKRYLARIANAAKPETPMDRATWEKNNPELRQATSRGLEVEVEAIRAVGATGSNNAAGQYKTVDFYDRNTNRVVTARADAFLGDLPVESTDKVPGQAPDAGPAVRPSTRLGEKSEVYFYDPDARAITFKWENGKWEPFSGRVRP